MANRLLRWFTRRGPLPATPTPPPPMRCPFCHEPMEPRRTNTELFVDPTGHGVYICSNIKCDVNPRYRRADLEADPDPVNAEVRAGIQAQYYRLQAETNEIVKYIRAHPRWSLYLGSFAATSDLVIHCLKIADGLLADKEHPTQ